MTDRQLELVPVEYMLPIDPSSQVARMPGLDAACPKDQAWKCRWPLCGCYWKHEEAAA